MPHLLKPMQIFWSPIKIDSIVAFRKKGYKSSRYDSRRLAITFRSNRETLKADAALTYAEIHKWYFKNYHHRVSFMHVRAQRECLNRFQPLQNDPLCADGIALDDHMSGLKRPG